MTLVQMLTLKRWGISIKDKNGDTAADLVPSSDKETAALIRKARAQASIAQEDVVDGANVLLTSAALTNSIPEDSEGEPGSGSGSEEED